MHSCLCVETGCIRGNDRQQILGIFGRVDRRAGSDDVVDVGMAQKKLADRKFRRVMRSLELTLLVARACHHRLADSVVKAKMFVTVRLPLRMETLQQLHSARSELGL